MNQFKTYCAAISARKIKFVLKPGASRLVEQQPTDLEEAAPRGGEVTFLYRSGKNRLLVIFAGAEGFDDFLVYQENGEREPATLEGRYASFEVDPLHAPKQIRFRVKGEAERFLTLAFQSIPGRKETLKALAPRIKDVGNSFILTYKNGSADVARTEVQLYRRLPKLTQLQSWGNHTYAQSYFPATGELIIPHDPKPYLSFRFKQFDRNGELLFDSGFLNPLLDNEESETLLLLQEELLLTQYLLNQPLD
jgi:hypothetical protein